MLRYNTKTGVVKVLLKWPNDRMVATVKHAVFLCKGEEATEKDNHTLLLDRCSTKYWHV